MFISKLMNKYIMNKLTVVFSMTQYLIDAVHVLFLIARLGHHDSPTRESPKIEAIIGANNSEVIHSIIIIIINK